MDTFTLNKFMRKVEETGWLGLPAALYRSAEYRLVRGAKRSYINGILRRALLVKAFPFRQPTVLLLSYPRSGSSWIGRILGHSPDFTYLREPITEAFQSEFTARALMDPGLHDISLACCMRLEGPMLARYIQLADDAFAGIPPRNLLDVVDKPEDFRFLQRGTKQLLIKEVNPFVTELLVTRYAPKTVMLVRHPAAIADSFERMGWLDERGFEEFGYQYGRNMAWAIEMSRKGDAITVLYENLAQDPLNQFPVLFRKLGVRLPAKFDRMVGEMCQNKQSSDHPHETRRSSRNEAGKWRKNLSTEKIESIMRGYLRSPLPYYRDDLPGLPQG